MTTKKYVIACMIMIIFQSLVANAYFTIESKNKKKDNLHTTYFLTPHNDVLPVKARLYAGSWEQNRCIQKTALNNIGQTKVQTGSFLTMGADSLQAVIGGGHNCMVISYFHHSETKEMIRLKWDGDHYIAAMPKRSQVKIY